MSYEHFAYLYDELMQDAPYDEWVRFVSEKLQKYQVNGMDMLDLACGTGELSVRFAKEGFSVSGVDLSADMLAVAQAKAQEHGQQIPFYEQDMANLEGHREFDIIGIFCDSLNYLKSDSDVIDTFANVFNHLKDDGLFFFDVHSTYKISEVFINQTFSFVEDHLSYIWNSFPGEYPDSVEHELTFFVLDEQTGKYDRFDELHYQRTYSVEQYTDWLEAAGFDILEVCADFENKQPQPTSERIFFIARKKPSL
jgi:SAM-dependent methyltransferase